VKSRISKPHYIKKDITKRLETFKKTEKGKKFPSDDTALIEYILNTFLDENL